MTPHPATAYLARWTWCPCQGLKEGVAIVIEQGRVCQTRQHAPVGMPLVDLSEGLLLPGLVNTHTHLELSFLAGAVSPRRDFVGWLHELVRARPEQDYQTAVQATARAVAELAGQGVACVADITNTGRAQPLLTAAGLSAVSFFEALGEAKVEPPAAAFTWRGQVLVGSGVAAHAPYSVSSARLRGLKASSGALPFCMHAAESQAEVEFMLGYGREGARLEEFLLDRGLARQRLGLTDLRPVWHLGALGILDQHTLLVHGVQLIQEEVRLLAESKTSLCLCPRSNLGLTGALAPLGLLLKAGVNLALGTDSLASAPDLSLWAEMTALRLAEPGVRPEVILTMATQGGARALGLAAHYGSLQPGTAAPLAFAPLPRLSANEVLEAVVSGETAGAPRGVAGHRLKDHSMICSRRDQRTPNVSSPQDQ
jgi:cytosine/adenosine deaminase-related metal-dependent hydrolase